MNNDNLLCDFSHINLSLKSNCKILLFDFSANFSHINLSRNDLSHERFARESSKKSPAAK